MERAFVIAAGGTGGHIIPGICIGREIERANADLRVEYLCGSRAIESRIYAAEGIEPRRLSVGAELEKKLPGARFATMGVDFAAILARWLLHRPAGVLAMGGAVCFPALFAARLLGVPVFLHESNRIPGRVVRMFRSGARRLFLGMGGAEGNNVETTGTPAKTRDVAVPARDTIACVGGSQGAARLNELFLEAARLLHPQFPWLKIVLVSGPGKAVEAPLGVEVRAYENDMPSLLSRAVAMVSRSGSGSMADIANFRVPAVLVPYPHAMDDHQLANARYFSDRGAALLAEEAGLDGARLADMLRSIISDAHLSAGMKDQLGILSTPDAACLIARRIREELDSPVLALRGDPRKASRA